MRSREKHLPFFAVLDAAKLPGCMLCRLVSEATRRYLEHLLYENVNDAGVRAQWRKARGFCHRHAWMLADSQDALGIAVLYLDLVASCGGTILAEKAGDPCAICDAEAHVLQGHLGTIEQYHDDAELRAAIDASDGLCGPHLRVVLQRIRDADTKRAFVHVSEAAVQRLGDELRRLIESFDYRRSPPDDERTRHAWRRAIEMAVGHRDVPEAT
ncbi:MAG: DUF6062 family protein [Phycisphaerae bacterium]